MPEYKNLADLVKEGRVVVKERSPGKALVNGRLHFLTAVLEKSAVVATSEDYFDRHVVKHADVLVDLATVNLTAEPEEKRSWSSGPGSAGRGPIGGVGRTTGVCGCSPMADEETCQKRAPLGLVPHPGDPGKTLKCQRFELELAARREQAAKRGQAAVVPPSAPAPALPREVRKGHFVAESPAPGAPPPPVPSPPPAPGATMPRGPEAATSGASRAADGGMGAGSGEPGKAIIRPQPAPKPGVLDRLQKEIEHVRRTLDAERERRVKLEVEVARLEAADVRERRAISRIRQLEDELASTLRSLDNLVDRLVQYRTATDEGPGQPQETFQHAPQQTLKQPWPPCSGGCGGVRHPSSLHGLCLRCRHTCRCREAGHRHPAGEDCGGYKAIGGKRCAVCAGAGPPSTRKLPPLLRACSVCGQGTRRPEGVCASHRSP